MHICSPKSTTQQYISAKVYPSDIRAIERPLWPKDFEYGLQVLGTANHSYGFVSCKLVAEIELQIQLVTITTAQYWHKICIELDLTYV